MSGELLAALVAAIIIIAALGFALTANAARDATKPELPARTIYDGTLASATPLVAHTLGLEGQPTAVTREADGTIAVIIARAGTAPPTPSTAEVIRLAAETLVAEEALGVRVQSGILRYSDRQISVAMAPALRELALRRLGEIRASDERGPRLERQNPNICRACAYRSMCAIGRINAPLPHSSMG